MKCHIFTIELSWFSEWTGMKMNRAARVADGRDQC